MPKHLLHLSSLAATIAFAQAAVAQEECTFQTNTGRIANSYDLVGVDACIAFCGETDGCTAWMYTPHTFNPDSAPGQCQLYAEASDPGPPSSSAPNMYCGQLGG